MAKPTQQEKTSFRVRLKQFGMVVAFTARRDKMFLPLVALSTIALPLILVAVVIAFGAGLLAIPIGIMAALLGFMIVLNLRAQKAMIAQAEGTPGAAAQIIENMRGDWRVRTAIAATTQYDMVHLVIGRPGVILIGEGNPSRVRTLIGQERRRLAKVIGSADLRDYTIGNDEGQLPLGKVRIALMKLPRTMTGREVNALDKRMTALSARPQMPKGAIPKNMRPPKGAFRAMRGR
jgi:hypothetical protein